MSEGTQTWTGSYNSQECRHSARFVSQSLQSPGEKPQERSLFPKNLIHHRTEFITSLSIGKPYSPGYSINVKWIQAIRKPCTKNKNNRELTPVHKESIHFFMLNCLQPGRITPAHKLREYQQPALLPFGTRQSC